MTALAGIWNFDGRPGADDCGRMLAAQSSYGRNDEAFWCEDGVAMGRDLWRTVPEDRFDTGPLTAPSGQQVLMADIRIDNREELVAACGISPDRAATLSDTAILLAALEHWGMDALNHVVGPFAFALWNRMERKLILARDAMAGRPLHYHVEANFFAFASMPKGLHGLHRIPKAPDLDRIAELFAQVIPDDSRTVFAGVSRVRSGHVVTITPSGVAETAFWQPKNTRLNLADANAYAEGLRHHIDLAVKSQLRGAEKVATHLSGGLDSSTITATAARQLGERSGRVVAFTSVPREGYDLPSPRGLISDEGALAAATAALYPNIEHVLIRGDATSPLAELDRNFNVMGSPTYHACNMVWGSAIMAQAKSRGLNVLLTGAAGNLTMSYNGLEHFAELVRGGHLMAWWRAASEVRRARVFGRAAILSSSVGPWMPDWMWSSFNRMIGKNTDRLSRTAIIPKRLRGIESDWQSQNRNWHGLFKPWSDGYAMRLWLLRRMDSADMGKGALAGWGIDVRDPTIDKRLVEYCLSVPAEQFLANGELRGLMRRAVADRLPEAVLREQRIGYQGADWHEGATRALPQIKEELDRLMDFAPANELIDIKRLREMVDTWPENGWEKLEVAMPYRMIVLRAIVFGHFLRRATGSNH